MSERKENVGPPCRNTIVVDGVTYTCERLTGDPHFPKDCMCETTITDEGGKSGRKVRWLTWRMVQPCATGGGA